MIVILDTETSGTDHENDHLVEVAWARFDDGIGKVVDCHSMLVAAEDNAAERVNGIPAGLLSNGYSYEHVQDVLCYSLAPNGWSLSLPILAHNASFDRGWFARDNIRDCRWICTQRHFEWPVEEGRDVSLERLALAHGIGVLPGHRAIYDVLTIVRVLERCFQLRGAAWFAKTLERAMRPRAIYEAHVSYHTNQLAKDQGFRWDGDAKRWWKDIANDDVPEMVSRVGFGISKWKECE